ncbi:Zn-ribbon domain-containing OB-fold protein [Pseudorhodoferax sp. Leaf267]|uniref:Zn-ribbon domain-containing OB-fold protein n=1 Tax=Pseudorhodoferax sp. Leaf267 TaxID=1736316 RepID=UPI0006FD71AA|nr:Zn-ribbon domain-containing OB-fold protein [Pseudorhodoferax sp. Leaf267]KQP19399.1 hypothetical protein ASF43_28895 [Pseudorhodoferax sp. Leaf267]
MNEYLKPLPCIDGSNRPFWEAARQGHLVMQQCSACAHVRFPISHVCPRCLALEHQWCTLSGRGTIYSYIVYHQVYNPAFKHDVPYNVAMIQLEEGPRLFSNVVGVANDVPKVGDAVQVVFEEVTPEVSLPRFRLCGVDAQSA